MTRLPGLKRILRIERDRAGVERAVDDELQFHFDMTMRELMSSGLPAEEARAEATRRFGDVQRTRERLATIDRSRLGRERRNEWWNAFAQDLRYAIRGLRLKPSFAIAVILTLGLGIGANATMFGIVDRLLFRPPTFLTAPDRAARLYFLRTFRGKEDVQSYTGYRRYLDLKEMTTSFDAMTPFYSNDVAVGSGETTKEMKVGFGAADLWKMFAVRPVIGRFFTASEDVPPNKRSSADAKMLWAHSSTSARPSTRSSASHPRASTPSRPIRSLHSSQRVRRRQPWAHQEIPGTAPTT